VLGSAPARSHVVGAARIVFSPRSSARRLAATVEAASSATLSASGLSARLCPSWPGFASPRLDTSKNLLIVELRLSKIRDLLQSGAAPEGVFRGVRLACSHRSFGSVDGGLDEVREVFAGRCSRSTSSTSSASLSRASSSCCICALNQRRCSTARG
jgi:hypothetical protein